MRRMNFQLPVLVLLALVISGIAGCGSGATANDTADHRITIVATTGMIADVVRNIAGDRAEVHALMGPGVDPHLYRPKRSDVSRLLAADLVLYNGLHLEGRMSETLEQIASSGSRVIAVAEALPESELLDSDEYPGTYDPHVWMDVRLWMNVCDAITDALIELDPAGASTYTGRSESYRQELESLHDWAQRSIATIPKEQRVLVTAHDAFNYLARAYDIEVEALQGISTESEAGLQKIESVVELLVSRRVAAVFTETSVNDKNVRTLIEGAKARGQAVRIGGELYSDALGAQETSGGTYVGMIEHNIKTITRALGGSVPDRRSLEHAAAEQP